MTRSVGFAVAVSKYSVLNSLKVGFEIIGDDVTVGGIAAGGETGGVALGWYTHDKLGVGLLDGVGEGVTYTGLIVNLRTLLATPGE